MARVPAKRSAARPTTPTRRPAARPATAAVAPTEAAGAVAAAAGSTDLAGSLRTLLASVEAEVRAVSGLSEKIDDLVRKLNEARDEQARRLVVLDVLRGSVEDANLGTFLDKAIRPRRTRVVEVVPDRLAAGN